MTGKTAFIYHPDYLLYQFGPQHPFQPIREKYTLDLLRDLELFNGRVKYHEPDPATLEHLLSVHSFNYIEFVKKMCERGYGYLDNGDTPATKRLYQGALSVVGGSIGGAKLIMEGQTSHAFNPGGGLHHAKIGSASGFCVFNDIAIATRFLQKTYGIKRVAIIDMDGHHGDGTQEILLNEPILKISTHRIGIFPGTGYVNEIGTGAGKGYSVNIPLPRGTDDETYLYAFNEVVAPLIKWYRPEIIINQFGVDGHYEDPLVGLALTTRTYKEASRKIHDFAHKFCQGRLLILGGGGYNIKNTSNCWAVMFVTVSEFLPEKSKKKYQEFFDRNISISNEGTFETVKKTVKKIKREIFTVLGI